MHITCSIHAKERMEQRKITQEQVETAIRNPQITLPTRDKRRVRVMKKFGSKTLDVIYVPLKSDRVILVTAMWLRKKERFNT